MGCCTKARSGVWKSNLWVTACCPRLQHPAIVELHYQHFINACSQVSWEPPADDHGAPVCSYTLDCSLVRTRGRDVSPVWHTVYSGSDTMCLVRSCHVPNDAYTSC